MNVIEENNTDVNQNELNIRLSDVVKFIKQNRLQLILGGIIGLVIGMIYIIPKPDVYTVQVTVMPEFRNKGGSLAFTSELLGLGTDNSATSEPSIRPDLYPNVLQSVPFALDMLNRPVYSKNLQKKITLQEFIEKTGEVNLISQVLGFFTSNVNADANSNMRLDPTNSSRAIEVTKKQDGLIKAVLGGVSSIYDKKTGIFTIKAVEPDPVVAATLARLSLDYLTNYITAYRTDKARNRVVFLEQQVKEAKQRYQTAEFALSEYRDRNRSLYLNTAKLDEQRLQANYLLEQSVYNDLAKQLEQAKIKVEEETPTFKVLEPAIVPLQKSGPRRTLTIVGFTVFAVVITLIIRLIKRVITGKRI